ncbi:hypothetical protein ACQ86G_13635 [Roseateles chitinivorans]|uniref:hypothetical protein n=1 Tax=Roseateles chitinivorans TaxID=2917965 RepID=UPI003D6705A8
MNSDTLHLVTEAMNIRNQRERAFREKYHAYLVEQKGHKGSLEEHLRLYASLGGFGQPLSADLIERFQPAIPFPAELVEFYREHGSLNGGNRLSRWTLLDLAEMERARASDYPYRQFHSLGLADMINYVWGNDRPEVDLDSGDAIFSREQLDHLNQNYQVVGFWTDIDAGDEAHYYIYYDRSGRFGLAYLHQDEWDIFDLLEESGARYSWDEVIVASLAKIEGPEDESED